MVKDGFMPHGDRKRWKCRLLIDSKSETKQHNCDKILIYTTEARTTGVTMEETDQLCQMLFEWSKKRKQAAEKLLTLARKLEELHSNVNTAKLVGNATSVAGIVGAGIATICTAGLATPLLVAAGAGAVVTLGSSLAEVGISRDDIKEAQRVIKEDEKRGKTIERLLEQLHEKCARQTPTTHASTASSNDAVESEVMTQLMGQIARHHNIGMPLELLRNFNRSTMYYQSEPGRLAPMTALNLMGFSAAITTTAVVAVGATVMTQGLKIAAKESFRFGAKEVGKDIGLIGIRTAITGGLKVAGFVVGLGLSLYDLIENIEEMVKDNHATDASRALRNTAREIQKSSEELQDKLDALREIIIKLSQLKEIIKNLGGYSFSMTPIEKDLVQYLIAACEDRQLANWLEQEQHQIDFMNLLRYSLKYLLTMLEDQRKRRIGHIHIVFVAHGEITYDFIPTSFLVPTPTIFDTVLYSPWNCAVDAHVVSGIALGSIMPCHRVFRNGQPKEVMPQNWNYMRRSPRPGVPLITVHPVTQTENAWKEFLTLYTSNQLCPREDRIIVPYLAEHQDLSGVPFYAFVFAMSWIVMLWGKTATVHLGACLSRCRGQVSTGVITEWAAQYAYTDDGVFMTANMNALPIDGGLYRAFKSMFG